MYLIYLNATKESQWNSNISGFNYPNTPDHKTVSFVILIDIGG